MAHLRRPSTSLLGSDPLPPLVGFALLAFAAAAIEPGGTTWPLVALAALVAAGLIAATAIVPWVRLPHGLLVFPAIGTIAIIAILRHSQGGSGSGYGPLVVLPVIWVALVVGRRAVLLVCAAATAMFALPLLIWGAPMYPASGWRSTSLWMIVSTTVGVVVAAVMDEQRQQAGNAELQAHAVAQALGALEDVASVARDISSGADARERICAAALSSVDATLVTVGERRGDVFAITGGAGVSAAVQSVVEPAASLAAFFSQHRVFIPDASQNAGISPILIAATGVRSVLFEPIIRHGRSIGVLGIGWSTPRASVDAKTGALIAYLAAEAGSAIERSDLLAQLADQARTDELTAIANRRAWDGALESALSEPVPICVALMDVDHFKAYNDRNGHVAGDRLLQDAARAWSQQIRPSDLLARYGGEEFAVLVRGCSLEQAQVVLEGIRRATPDGVTCSLGVAERRTSDTPESLLLRADGALYRAKNDGRDQLRAA